jgi:hypothetical protein
MKQLYITLVAVIAITQFSYGQNTFPNPSGNVGIGINTGLNAPLTVQGGGITTGLTDVATTVTTKFNVANTAVALGLGYVSSDNPFLQAFNNVTNNPHNLLINPFGGNVGVGTTTPGANMEIFELSDSKPAGVVAAAKSALKLSRAGTPNYSYPESAEFRLGHGGPNVWGSKLDLFINGGTNQNNIPDQQVMTWLYNGNVGVGTTSPDQKLTVKGTIHSQEVKVDMNILPDYVFDKTYELAPLKQVKDFIDKNHHLPEVPSAEQVSREGLKLGEMNALLLKKVEELTLYAIQQKEENQKLKEDQQKTAQAQQQQIDELKAQVAKLIKQ